MNAQWYRSRNVAKMAAMDASSSFCARVAGIQLAIRDQPGLDGWLFYDFRHLDPIAYRVLLLDPSLHVTRRWYYWIPAEGSPIKLYHRIEPHVLDGLPGEARPYVSWREQQTVLGCHPSLRQADRHAILADECNTVSVTRRCRHD